MANTRCRIANMYEHQAIATRHPFVRTRHMTRASVVFPTCGYVRNIAVITNTVRIHAFSWLDFEQVSDAKLPPSARINLRHHHHHLSAWSWSRTRCRHSCGSNTSRYPVASSRTPSRRYPAGTSGSPSPSCGSPPRKSRTASAASDRTNARRDLPIGTYRRQTASRPHRPNEPR